MNNNIIWQPTDSSNHREKQASIEFTWSPPGHDFKAQLKIFSLKIKFKFYIPILSKINPALK